MISRLISCLVVICATADRWGAGRGDGPCMLLVGIVLAGGMLMVGNDRDYCAYARYQILKVLPIDNQ